MQKTMERKSALRVANMIDSVRILFTPLTCQVNVNRTTRIDSIVPYYAHFVQIVLDRFVEIAYDIAHDVDVTLCVA